MDSLLHIGNQADSDTVIKMAAAISAVFESGRRNRMHQDTIRVAIQALTQASEIKNITVRDSTFTTRATPKKAAISVKESK